MSEEELDAAAARIQGAVTAATGGKEAELDAAAALIQGAVAPPS